MLISLTVGKVDAGVAVLLTQDKRLVNTLPAHISNAQPTNSVLLLDRIPLYPAAP
jgi:hypothetical protein